MSEPSTDETTVNDSYSVTVPAAIRREADIEAGDKLRWRIEPDGTLRVDVISQRTGAFSELDPIDIGEATDAAADHDVVVGDN